jgi:hypothetical protein
MYSNRYFARSQLISGLLIKQPVDYKWQNVSLPGSQSPIVLHDIEHRLALSPRLPGFIERRVNCLEQYIVIYWNHQEVSCTLFHSPDYPGDVMMRGDKNQAQGIPIEDVFSQFFEPCHAVGIKVGNQAGRNVAPDRLHDRSWIA